MPSKYSHSVVLAWYSNRGLISLPNDQHFAYLKPQLTYRSVSQNDSQARAYSSKSKLPQHPWTPTSASSDHLPAASGLRRQRKRNYTTICSVASPSILMIVLK